MSVIAIVLIICTGYIITKNSTKGHVVFVEGFTDPNVSDTDLNYHIINPFGSPLSNHLGNQLDNPLVDTTDSISLHRMQTSISDDPYNWRRVHIKLGTNGEKSTYSIQPPSARGINGCTQVPCPQKFNKYNNVVCWNCCNFH
jgi:hypothetical protein